MTGHSEPTPGKRRRLRRWALASAVTLAVTSIPFVLNEYAHADTGFSTTLVNTVGNQCADVPGGAATDRLALDQATCDGSARQSFTFTAVSGQTDTYGIGTLNSGKCVDVTARSKADNAAIIQYGCNGRANQQFRLVAVSSTAYNLVAVHSGKCLAADAGNALVQLPCTTARAWKLPGHGSSGGGTSSPTPSASTTSGTKNTYTNPLKLNAPDPFMTYYNGSYYLAATTWNNTITMRKSATLGGLSTATDKVIQTLTRPNGAGTMWAPDFHLLDGPDGKRWYMYYTAGQEPFDLGTQRIHVLESAGTDPMGPYTFKADMLDPEQDDTWELDPEILQLNGKMYLLGTVYTGSQPMFIRELSNPWTAAGTRHILSTPAEDWETIGGAVNEAPAVLQHDGKTFITFSASHCSTPDYKLGMLTYVSGDPLNSSSWRKSGPVFQRSDANGVFGPGSNGFFTSPDGTENWIVYSANDSADGGCDMNRSTRAQKFTWNADGTPNFGTPVALGKKLTAPSGE